MLNHYAVHLKLIQCYMSIISQQKQKKQTEWQKDVYVFIENNLNKKKNLHITYNTLCCNHQRKKDKRTVGSD